MKQEERGTWANKAEFILSCLGYAIGIGNVWRFPYLCYRNGGGAFLLPYTLMLFVCGLPLFFLETSIGQFSRATCINVFRINPLFKGIGYVVLFLNMVTAMYFCVIMAYPLIFIYYSLGKDIPWENCNNPWNTPNCTKLTGEDILNITITDEAISTPAEEFFYRKMLKMSDSVDDLGGLVWPVVLTYTIGWIAVFFCIVGGVKSIGKVVYFTVSFPFAILGILLFRGVTLPGASVGLEFYLSPDWSQLKNVRVWADAAIQIFFSLGPGWGGIVTMASFNKFHDDNLSASIIVPLVNSFTSIFAGGAVFSTLGFLAHRSHRPVASVATAGPGLVYVTYPTALAMLPWSNFWSILFFAMLFFLGIDSLFVGVETTVAAIVDEHPHFVCKLGGRRRLTIITCTILWMVGIVCCSRGGLHVVQLLDWYVATHGVLVCCILECLAVGWTYGAKNFQLDIEFMRGKSLSEAGTKLVTLCWKYITPGVLMLITVATILWNYPLAPSGKPYPMWARQFGWTIGLGPLLIVVVMGFLHFKKQPSNIPLLKRFRLANNPSSNWGPADAAHRYDWMEYKMSKKKRSNFELN